MLKIALYNRGPRSRDSDGDACTPARGAVAAALLLFVGRRYYDEKWMFRKFVRRYRYTYAMAGIHRYDRA